MSIQDKLNTENNTNMIVLVQSIVFLKNDNKTEIYLFCHTFLANKNTSIDKSFNPTINVLHTVTL